MVLHLRWDDDTDRIGFDTGAAGLGAGARVEFARSWLLDVEFRNAGARPLLVLAEGRSWFREVEARNFGFCTSPAPAASPARLSRDGLGRSDDVDVVGLGIGAGWMMPDTGRGSREGRGMPLTRLCELSIFTSRFVCLQAGFEYGLLN